MRLKKPGWRRMARCAVNVLFCTVSMTAHAERTFIWSGDDPRFSGWFSISDADFERRSFDMVTGGRYEFRDSLSPVVNVVLEDPRGFQPGNAQGNIKADGTGLSHSPDPRNPNTSFWVANWQPPGISVGMYGHNEGQPFDLFTYANYERNFFAEAQGFWILSVPEPSTVSLTFGMGSLALFWSRKKPSARRRE